MIARALLLLALAAPAAASEARLVPSVGFAWLDRGPAGRRTQQSGVAVELRLEAGADPRLRYGATLGWGLTDWDRARQWIDAGNRAGSWTTDRFADVEAWVREGKGDDTLGLRLIAAAFADFFLATTYVAVPFCYAGSIGGATSHLQLDVTASLHLTGGRNDAWLELGGGAMALPERVPPENRFEWRRAAGPVAGVGMRLGALRIGARFLVAPPALNTSSRGGTVLAGAATVGFAR